MGCKVVLFYFLVTSSAFVDCYPYPEGNTDGAYQIRVQQRDPRYFQSRPNQLWANQGIAQSTQNPAFAWNQNNYKDIGRQQIDMSKSARPVNVYGYGQQMNSYDNVTPVATLQNGYNQWPNAIIVPHSTPNPHSANEGWWNNQKLHQQQQGQFYGKPYEENTFAQNNVKPFVNQANYGQGYYKSAGLIAPEPINNFNSYRQGWLPQNQYKYISTPAPNALGYLPWPIPDDQESQPIESNSPNEYNKPEPEDNQSKDLGITPPESVQSDGQEPILSWQQPVKNQSNILKHYIIIHMNRTYEHMYNLDDIMMDEFNVAHMKSKGVPVLAIIEVEETNETEKPSTLEVPYDSGITKIPRDTDQNTNEHDSPGTQSYRYPFIQTTTEDTTYDMNYFKPEYIMPIQPTTGNIIHSTTNSSPQTATTNGNIDTDKNRFVMYYDYATENTIGFDNTNNSTTKSTTESTSHSTTDNTTESTTDSITDNSNNSTTKSTTESTIHSTTDDTTESTTDSITDNTNYSTIESTSHSTTDNTTESTTDSITDNTNYSTIESTSHSTTDNTTESTTDSITNNTNYSTIESTSHSTTDNTTDSITDNTNNSTTDDTIIRATGRSTYFIGTSTEPSQYYTAETNDKNQEYIFTTQTTDIPQRAQFFYKYQDYEDFDYNDENKYNTRNTKSYTSQQTSKIHRNKYGNSFGGFDKIQSRNLPKWNVKNRGSENDKPTYNEPEQIPNGNDAFIQRGESTPESGSLDTSETKRDLCNENYSKEDESSINREPNKLREDLHIDVSELKTVVDEPVVWFRPDYDFWDKVTKGEQAFDAVSFYDVHCRPKLIERVTTIHHFANGTESVEYVETIWDSPDDINPRSVRSEKEFRDPES